MTTFTIEQDKTVRVIMHDTAKAISAKFTSAYQGDYIDTVTDTTLGDRLQVGAVANIAGVRYLLTLTYLVSRNTGGRVAVRVATYRLDSMGRIAGNWTIAKTALAGTTLTSKGWQRRIGNTYSDRDMVQYTKTVFDQTRALIKLGQVGSTRVQLTKRYGPDHPQYGETYDTSAEHLNVWGGKSGATQRLMK